MRVNTAFFRDPARLSVSDAAFKALLALQAEALDHDRDGIVYQKEYTPKGGYPGLHRVDKGTLGELEEADLLERYQDDEGPGVRVTWRGQSTAEERRQNRERKKKNQQDYRDRNKLNSDTLSSRESVTGNEPVTNLGVGQERTRRGKDEDREGEREVRNVSRADPTPAGTSLPETVWPATPPKERPAWL